MTVYVDTEAHRFRGKDFHYLFVNEREGDNIAELTAFARRSLSLPLRWLRKEPGWHHFEISPVALNKALAAGAIPVQGLRAFGIIHGAAAAQRVAENMGHELS